MRATQLGDVVDALEGHRELFTRGTDEHDRSVTESEVVVAHREVMRLGVCRQSGVLLAVNDSEPKLPPAGFGGASRVLIGRVRPQLSDRCATDRGNTLDKSRVLRLPFCNLGRLDVLLKFLEEELLLPFGDEDRRFCDLTCWGLFLLDSNKLRLGTRPARLQALEHQVETGEGGEGEVCARGFRLIYWGRPGGLELLSQALPVLAPAPAKATTSARHRRRDRREGLRRGRRGHQDVRTVSLSHLR